MRDWIEDIRTKTADMNRKDTLSYIWTYYWYHILIFLSVLALIFIFIVHYATYKKPEFTCVMINQKIDTPRDNWITKQFAEEAGIKEKRININSNYNFSYGKVKLDDVNESSYEKFFLQWKNHELDAVIMPESFYRYCKKLGGEFRTLDNWQGGTYETYIDKGKFAAVVIGKDQLTGEKLLLAFPKTGKHEKASRMFMKYISTKKGGKAVEKIING